MFDKKSRLSSLSPKDLLDKPLIFQVLKEILEHMTIKQTNSNLYPEIT